jgi:FlaA1/EpsC-like NDP-sugar epimerase
MPLAGSLEFYRVHIPGIKHAGHFRRLEMLRITPLIQPLPQAPPKNAEKSRVRRMTVLVTGGAGYIGSHTVHDLVDAGESVVVLDNLSTGFASALPKPMLPIVGDVGDQALVATLIEEHKVDAIIHFAGSTIVPESMSDPLGYYGNNTANSRALIEAAVKGGVRHSSFPRLRRCAAIRRACRSPKTIRPCRCRPMAGRS